MGMRIEVCQGFTDMQRAKAKCVALQETAREKALKHEGGEIMLWSYIKIL
jgi:hypothetical protein